ncbi:MAG TPA: hypothetical protein VGQ00_03270 [Candidatus Norongarragalinales archaeon]|nr:hypothetical protein [Candidatus Norongarragalinales archaeon]
MARSEMPSWVPLLIALLLGIAMGYAVALYTVPSVAGGDFLSRGIAKQPSAQTEATKICDCGGTQYACSSSVSCTSCCEGGTGAPL